LSSDAVRKVLYPLVAVLIAVYMLWDWATHFEPYYKIESYGSS